MGRGRGCGRVRAGAAIAVFLAPGGIAFHEGSLGTRSAGCVRLARDEAAAFSDFLRVGDRVEVR